MTCTECGGGSRHGFRRGLCPKCYERGRRRARGTKPRGRQPCSREGCSRPHYGRGECERHYRETVRREKGIMPRQPKVPVECSEDGCSRPFHARGLCKIHYWRDYYWRRQEGAVTPRSAPVAQHVQRGVWQEDGDIGTVHWPRWGDDGNWTCPDCGEVFHRQQEAA